MKNSTQRIARRRDDVNPWFGFAVISSPISGYPTLHALYPGAQAAVNIFREFLLHKSLCAALWGAQAASL